MLYEAITSEIAAKGKAYLVLGRCRRTDLPGILKQAGAELRAAGAEEILVTGTILEVYGIQNLPLTEAYRMVWMERRLGSLLPRPERRITLHPLERQDGEQFLSLYNQCFFDVPNSATYTRHDLERMEEEHCRAGFVQRLGASVGIYEVKPGEDMPEIHSVGIIESKRGKGLGRALMAELMIRLRTAGFHRCKLLVSSANGAAYTLYKSLGFRPVRVQSRWYKLEK